ncbi:AraC family transcriptional regulator [Erysipelothrix rhusiopathiae]|nr:AraC family transcriptional regulator [Erysipelothrix rhusiopathiae]RNM31972.1 AraC family transcriptional regulator [Erysipelothrix rhusiopathiae]
MNNLYFEHYSFSRADSPLIVEHCEFDLSTATNAFYWHNDFEIILVKTGLCEIDIEDEVFTAMKDTVVFINPGQTRRIVSKTEGITLDQICRDIGISKFYYCRLFKEETDTTINNYLNEVRCHYAYELLSESNLRVGEVAKACGYNSTSYFTKIFKHLFGYPPSHVEKTVV